ncbi:efflux transporter outer membrane subunit [Roseibium aggregatum]|uniref:efflux transporter outer membrane subunit n=1 Tax=Roseibium aggregatum TaxID=187304 RepID=UPI001E658825|nr:efflux transporter outer membrane subunit [Roseibium aggregatum]UES54993.1 efflux transporter outer membrane subunit [Roseibium aggregatum]
MTLFKPETGSACAVPSQRRKTWLRLGAGLMAATLLGACSVGPDYQRPDVSVPGKWRNTTGETPASVPQLANWWTQLGDAQLNSLISLAVQNNLDVRTAKAKVREARASYKQASSSLFPSLDGAAGVTRSKSSGSDSVGTLWNGGFDAAWEIDIFGANRRAKEAAKYGLDAAEEELRASLLTLIGDLATNYVEARGFQQRLKLAQDTAKSQQSSADLIRKRFQAGSSSGLDVANAEGQAASTEANIPALKTALAASMHRLSVLTGQQPTALTDRLLASSRIPTPKLPIPVGIPASILLTRPDVRLAERQLAEATAKIGQATAARYPSVSLTGSIGTAAADIGDLGKNSSISWAFGPSLSVPIFNAGKLAAGVEIAEAQRDQYFLAYQASVLTALEDVENALVGFTQERKRVASQRRSAESYKSAAELSRSLYQTGAASFLDALDAERSTYSAEDTLIQSRVRLTTYYIALQKALGGGWTGKVETDKPEVVDKNTSPHLSVAY